MSDADDVEVAAPAMRSRWPRRFFGTLGLLLAVVALAGVLLDTSLGHRFVADRIAAFRPANGLRFSVGRIEGSLYSRSTLADVRVYDPQGLVFVAPSAKLDWSPFAWANNRLDITSLVVPQATLAKLLKLRPTGRTGPILPGFDIHVGLLQIDHLTIGKSVTGKVRSGGLVGRADIHDRRALVRLAASVEGSDRLRLLLDAAPDHDRFDVDLHARGARGGVLANVTGLGKAIAIDVAGRGSWQHWQGSAQAKAGAARIVDLALTNQAGRYSLSGTLTPASITHGKLQRLTSPRVLVNGAATLADRRLTGHLSLRSAALTIDANGALDLAASAYRNVRLKARLLRPPALFPNMTGRNIELRAVFDGPFQTARFDYRLIAERFAFDDTGFEDAQAVGRGHLSKSPVQLPVRFHAARVTGVGDVAGGILRNLTVDGLLRVTSKLVLGDDLKLSSDKLSGRINLTLDLVTGKYNVGINGALGRYLIPGLGIVDVRSELHVVPGPGGHGTRVVGRGTAQMVRLDNTFFRGLAGGLPRIESGLERTPDGILHLNNLVLSAPDIRLTGNGYRRRDGTFHFEGGGTQRTYGPLTLVLDGQIDHPTLDLTFASPNASLGLKQVKAHLDPTPQGFAFTAQGGSRLGPFSASGQILLPPGQNATIAFAALDVSGSHASGALQVASGGFDGKLDITKGGITGALLFKPVGNVQRIEGHLDLANAKLDAFSVRRGHTDFAVMLDPAGTSLEASATGTGLRNGALAIARFAGSAKLRGGVGEIRASIAGSRGRAFDLQTVTQVSSDRYVIQAQGTIDRQPLKLLSPATFSRDSDGWALAPTRLRFAGGNAQVSGRFSSGSTAIQADVSAMPLTILDIGFPGLELGGSAYGKLSYAKSGDAAPTGSIAMTIRGLTRSGLVATSTPIDLGLAGVLQPGKLGVRAVMASGGKTIGRGQALIAPLGQGDLATRIANAPLIGQLRYNGPADTLWRLTGVELFDLTGPLAVGADARGSLAHPTIQGIVQANGARIESTVTGTLLTNVQASGRFGGSKLVIDRFAADAGKSGRVTGTGTFDFGAASGLGIDLKLQTDHAVMINRDDIGATVTGPLAISSSGAGGKISGDLKLNRSRYRLGQATVATAVPQLNVREINLPGGGAEEDEAPSLPWTLAIHARATSQLIVSGLGLNSEWSADLQLGGQPDNPAITGRADLIRGDYEFAGREFQLERGIIRFAGEQPANPALDIAANADSTGLSATIRVTGNATKPEIDFTSVPALPEDELLSRLLFGTSITNLSAPEALQLAAAVAALQNGGTGLNPINAVRRAAGLDRLRILPADPQTKQGTSIAAGKYITRKLYAEIVTDGQGYSATQVEFQVTRWLSLLSSVSTLGRQSVNVRVSKDY